MIHQHSKSTPIEMFPGITRYTLITTEKLMICEFNFNAGTEIPSHAHPHEQVGYVVSGKVIMTIDGKDYELTAGDSYAAPSGITHSARIVDDTIIIDTFSPPREDYK
jgi:quercetin dioxygenase-like cupin family protein